VVQAEEEEEEVQRVGEKRPRAATQQEDDGGGKKPRQDDKDTDGRPYNLTPYRHPVCTQNSSFQAGSTVPELAEPILGMVHTPDCER
jgi:hypothetical protein